MLPQSQVHYQLPASADLYVHRSGRTARAAEDGIAVAMVTPADSRRYDALLKALGRPAPPEFPVVSFLLPLAAFCLDTPAASR